MRQLTIQNFKCFSNQTISLNRLTVLCGPNAGGKSTIIQALLLLHLAGRLENTEISLNGPFGLHLGDADSLLCRNQDRGEISEAINFSLNDGDTVIARAEFIASDHSARRLQIIDRRPRISNFGSAMAFSFSYLSAERSGPRVVQESFSDDSGTIDTVGHAGQFTGEMLAAQDRTKVRPEISMAFDEENKKETPVLFLHAVQNWLSVMFGPIEVQVRQNGNAPPSIYFKRPGVAEDWTIASNTGFGLSYALPIIVAGLLVPLDGTLIVDSPEAHLHPAAQTAIAKFLCKIAASGVHVLLETHSDYILDGIRISLTSPEISALPREQCTFLSLSNSEDGKRTLTEVSIGENGKPTSWPDGFFDQQVTNLRTIVDNVRTSR